MTIIGLCFSVATLFRSNVNIMNSPEAGWLPLIAITILTIGLLECIDAYRARKKSDFFLSVQLAVLDTVTGFVLLFELSETVETLPILVAVYLMCKGFFRVVAALSVKFPHAKQTMLGGLISVLFGMMVWKGWPISEFWLLPFCLSFDMATRGYALTRFAIWLNTVAKNDQPDIRSLM